MENNFEELLKARIEEHRKVIIERSEWIKKYRPQASEAHTFSQQSEYNTKKKRWEDTISVSYSKIDEVKKIASLAGIRLS